MESWKKIIAIGFGIAVVGFSIPTILAIWGIISVEVGWRSAITLGVIFLSLLIVSIIINNLSKKK